METLQKICRKHHFPVPSQYEAELFLSWNFFTDRKSLRHQLQSYVGDVKLTQEEEDAIWEFAKPFADKPKPKKEPPKTK